MCTTTTAVQYSSSTHLQDKQVQVCGERALLVCHCQLLLLQATLKCRHDMMINQDGGQTTTTSQRAGGGFLLISFHFYLECSHPSHQRSFRTRCKKANDASARDNHPKRDSKAEVVHDPVSKRSTAVATAAAIELVACCWLLAVARKPMEAPRKLSNIFLILGRLDTIATVVPRRRMTMKNGTTKEERSRASRAEPGSV